MVKTVANRWLTKHKGGRAWAKLVLGVRDINLSERGWYAIVGAYVDFDSPVMLKTGQFLVITSQYPTGNKYDPWEFHNRMVTRWDQPGTAEAVIVPETLLYETTYSALDRGIIPAERRSGAIGKFPYMAAVFAYLRLTEGPLSTEERRLDAILNTPTRHQEVRLHGLDAEAVRPRRRVDRIGPAAREVVVRQLPPARPEPPRPPPELQPPAPVVPEPPDEDVPWEEPFGA